MEPHAKRFLWSFRRPGVRSTFIKPTTKEEPVSGQHGGGTGSGQGGSQQDDGSSGRGHGGGGSETSGGNSSDGSGPAKK